MDSQNLVFQNLVFQNFSIFFKLFLYSNLKFALYLNRDLKIRNLIFINKNFFLIYSNNLQKKNFK